MPRPLSDQEIKYRLFSRKSAVANQTLNEETVLRPDMAKYLRTNPPGIDPLIFQRLFGKKLKKKILQDEVIHEKDLE